ncbi:MAG TPA: diguanylate cyclase [Myxococcota bacterium]|nr:diguanylate cyclase [Myxococcota bacterium]
MTHRFARYLPHLAFQSLAARIGFFVFGATLISALAVALTSAHALRGFLRSKIEEKLPSVATQVHDRLNLWFAQRTLDVQVFARSAILVDGLAGRERLAAEDRQAIEKYLDYVLAGSPQYASLFALDTEGHTLFAVGQPVELEPELRRSLAAVEDTAVSQVVRIAGNRVQIVSSVIRARNDRVLATLHAVLGVDALTAQLSNRELGESGRLILFDREGTALAATPGVDLSGLRRPAELAVADPATVHDYTGPDGVHIVASVRPMDGLGWTLVVQETSDDAFAPIAQILQNTLLLNMGIVAVLSLVAFKIATSMVGAIHNLSDAARRVRDGEPDVVVPVTSGGDEVGILTRTFAEMVERLHDARLEIEVRRQESENANRLLLAQNHELQRANETLEQLAITDGLTKIHNHRFFQDQLFREIKRAERTGSPLALILLDIDDFKQLNDRYGHAVGDEVLQLLSAVLIEETRDHDLVARYGGEEFAVLAPATDRDGTLLLAEKLRTAVAEHRFCTKGSSAPLSITVSIGLAIYHGDRSAFFDEADRALYEAKGAGKDCVVAALERSL